MADRSQLMKQYGAFVGRVWEGEESIDALKANPHQVLNRYGFAIPADATITLVFADLNSTGGSRETQMDAFVKGDETGVYVFVIPTRPQDVDPWDIPLHEEVLDLMAGGSAAGCCPCSTCCCPCCNDASEA